VRKVLSVLAIVAAASLPAASAQELSVHVRGARLAPPSKEAEAQLRAKAESAGKALDERREAAKKQFGKDAEKWPAATRDAVQAAHETVMQAEADWFYVVELKQKDIDDSVADLEKALSERKGLRVAPEASADLVLEVVGRARVQGEGWGGQGAPESRLVFRARPGAGLDVATLSKSAGSWDPAAGFWSKASTQTWHRLSADEPYWLLMSRKPGTGWMASYKGAAGEAAKAVEKFALDNAAALSTARQAASR
jgi:hypothetical protein